MSYVVNTDGSMRESESPVEPRYGCYATPKEAADNFITKTAVSLNSYLTAIRDYMDVIKKHNKFIHTARKEQKHYEARGL